MPDPTRKTISATEASALVDASPYVTKWLLYRRFVHGEDYSDAENNRMSWGKKLEPLILQAAAEELRLEVIPNKDGGGDQVYERRGLLGCTRDATVICPDRGPGAMDSKCVFDYGVWMRDWGGGKGPPRHVEIQLQVQMYVGDGDKPFTWGTIPAWVGGEIKYFERKPIPKLWAMLEEKATAFFADVEAKREPEPFGATFEIEALNLLFPTQVGNPLMMDELTKENLAIAEKVRTMKWHGAERLGHEKGEKAIKAELQALAKEHDAIHLPYGIRVDIKQQARAGFTVKPTTFKVVDAYVPKDLPEGNIGDV